MFWANCTNPSQLTTLPIPEINFGWECKSWCNLEKGSKSHELIINFVTTSFSLQVCQNPTNFYGMSEEDLNNKFMVTKIYSVHLQQTEYHLNLLKCAYLSQYTGNCYQRVGRWYGYSVKLSHSIITKCIPVRLLTSLTVPDLLVLWLWCVLYNKVVLESYHSKGWILESLLHGFYIYVSCNK